MKTSILTIEPVAKNYPTFEKNDISEVLDQFYKVYDRAVMQGRGFVDASEQTWFEMIDSFFSEGSGLQ